MCRVRSARVAQPGVEERGLDDAKVFSWAYDIRFGGLWGVIV